MKQSLQTSLLPRKNEKVVVIVVSQSKYSRGTIKMTKLNLHIPSENELSYRGYLISDEATMSYNMGYGDNGGCTYRKTAEQLCEWYQYWKTPDRFYAYIQRDNDHAFIGEVNLHENEKNDWFEMGIIIEARYRGMGFSVPALRLF